METGNELVVQQNGIIPGLEDATQEDLILPRIKMSGKAGTFENLLTGDIKKELECVILTRTKGRQLWGSDDKVECRSRDRMTGSKYGSCEACPRKEWREEMKNDREARKKLCRATYDFLLLLLDENVPYAMTVSAASSMGPAKKYISSFLVKKEPLFAYTTMMSLEEKKGPEASYYALCLERGSRIDIDAQRKYLGLMNKYRLHNVAEEAPEEPAEEKLGDLPF